jgi:hypothetical protein
MKTLFSRWNNAPSSEDKDSLLQPFSWSSTHHLTTATPLAQILPLHPVKDLKAASSHEPEANAASPDPYD